MTSFYHVKFTVRLSAAQTRKDIMAASISKNNDKAREVARLSPLSVFYERVWRVLRGSCARPVEGPHARGRPDACDRER